MIVGGTFDRNGGKVSSIVDKIFNEASNREDFSEIILHNGGFINDLRETILEKCKQVDIVFWMPNVSNDEEKIRNVKEVNPKVILISSKRNDNKKYNFAELITRALELKSNLIVEFSKVADKKFKMMVFDPLGNVFYNGEDIAKMSKAMFDRAIKLTTFTRCPTKKVETNDNPSVPDEEEFFAFARSCSDIFHNLINPAEDTKHFLGNMSFRCQNGFPSFRGKNGIIYVSRRNVNKANINKDSFVPTYLDENENTMYYGDNKPSVDTPVQLRLYKKYPHMNYMIHAHCYFYAPFDIGGYCSYTWNPVPCGALEEVEEIEWTIANEITDDDDNEVKFVAVNLIGHGCLLMASDVSYFTRLMEHKDNCFIKRPMPEMYLQHFKDKLFDRFAKNSLNYGIKFEQAVMPIDEFAKLVRASDKKELSMVQDEYCCHGSHYNCWQEYYHTGNWGATKKDTENVIIERYKYSVEHYPDRIYIAKRSSHYYVAILARDIEKSDYRIYI